MPGEGTNAATIAVAGAGTMGTGIAIVAARGGAQTIVFDVDGQRAQAAPREMRCFFKRLVELGRMSRIRADEVHARTRATDRLIDLAEADLVIEAVFEEFTVKSGLIRSLDDVLQPEGNRRVEHLSGLEAHFQVSSELHDALGDVGFLSGRRARIGAMRIKAGLGQLRN